MQFNEIELDSLDFSSLVDFSTPEDSMIYNRIRSDSLSSKTSIVDMEELDLAHFENVNQKEFTGSSKLTWINDVFKDNTDPIEDMGSSGLESNVDLGWIGNHGDDGEEAGMKSLISYGDTQDNYSQDGCMENTLATLNDIAKDLNQYVSANPVDVSGLMAVNPPLRRSARTQQQLSATSSLKSSPSRDTSQPTRRSSRKTIKKKLSSSIRSKSNSKITGANKKQCVAIYGTSLNYKKCVPLSQRIEPSNDQTPPPIPAITATATTTTESSQLKPIISSAGVHGLNGGRPMLHLLESDIPGRIGAYTTEERRKRIKRFHEKRKQRVWTKRINYGCRKRLADDRPRVRGRFVKCV
jgi:hypothetical protein